MQKILLFDIETAPNIASIWGLWTETTSMEMIEKEWYVLCWCAKWLDKKKVISSALPDFKQYKKGSENDLLVLKKLWKLLDEADIVIAHNAVKFDIRKTNARFIINGLTPPSPYKVIDTLRVARRFFYFTSNRLNDLGEVLKVGNKMQTGGFKLWRGCLAGDVKSWDKMVKYCKQDVILLEKIYKKMLPYISNHPNLTIYVDDNKKICPKCGKETLIKQGIKPIGMGLYQKYACKNCGGWSRGRKNLRENKINITN